MSPKLTVTGCSYPQARRAVRRWHYSGSLPAAGLDLFGVREGGRFVGVVIFGMGANPRLASPFGLGRHEVRELVRVALADGRYHRTSRVLATCLRRFHHQRPEVRLLISYADPAHGHTGTLYQAGNWTYLGTTNPARTLVVHGRRCHPRSLYQRYGTSSLDWLRCHVDPATTAVLDPGKHKYAVAFDGQMRRRLGRLACAYPRAVKESKATRPATSGKGHVRSVLTAPHPSGAAPALTASQQACKMGVNKETEL